MDQPVGRDADAGVGHREAQADLAVPGRGPIGLDGEDDLSAGR